MSTVNPPSNRLQIPSSLLSPMLANTPGLAAVVQTATAHATRAVAERGSRRGEQPPLREHAQGLLRHEASKAGSAPSSAMQAEATVVSAQADDTQDPPGAASGESVEAEAAGPVADAVVTPVVAAAVETANEMQTELETTTQAYEDAGARLAKETAELKKASEKANKAAEKAESARRNLTQALTGPSNGRNKAAEIQVAKELALATAQAAEAATQEAVKAGEAVKVEQVAVEQLGEEAVATQTELFEVATDLLDTIEEGEPIPEAVIEATQSALDTGLKTVDVLESVADIATQGAADLHAQADITSDAGIAQLLDDHAASLEETGAQQASYVPAILAQRQVLEDRFKEQLRTLLMVNQAEVLKTRAAQEQESVTTTAKEIEADAAIMRELHRRAETIQKSERQFSERTQAVARAGNEQDAIRRMQDEHTQGHAAEGSAMTGSFAKVAQLVDDSREAAHRSSNPGGHPERLAVLNSAARSTLPTAIVAGVAAVYLSAGAYRPNHLRGEKESGMHLPFTSVLASPHVGLSLFGGGDGVERTRGLASLKEAPGQG